MPERMMIQERRVAKPRPETECRRASLLSVLSHAAVSKYGVDVQTDNPARLAAEAIEFRRQWRLAHGTGPLDHLRIKALTDRVRILREVTDPNQEEF